MPASISLSRSELVAVARARQFRDWHRGRQRLLEDYLQVSPALLGTPEAIVELADQEVLLREQSGEAPTPDEYLSRFPQCADLLRRRFHLHQEYREQDQPAPATPAILTLPPFSGVNGSESQDADTLAPLPPGHLAGVFEPGVPTAGACGVPGYELLSELGRGGMGVVYKARHQALNRTVALKMILSGGHAGVDDLARFRTEAEAIARLQHPHIVQIYEVGTHGGLPYFSLEFCASGSLEKTFQGKPLSASKAAALVEKLARAMFVAHQKGIIHRDLKPANVLLTEDGTPKITDFGLAKKLDEIGRTSTGSILGTPSYMAPEQAGGQSKEIGPAVDVYALGAILYELLTSQPPFKAASPLDTLLQVLHKEPVPPRRLRANTPKDLETFCLKCLQKGPHQRYATALDLAEDLRRFQAGEPIRARAVGWTEQAWKWVRRNPVVAGLLTALLLILLGGLASVTGLWLDTARQRDAAEANLALAEKAVDECFLVATTEPLLQQDRMRAVRKLLMEKALPFYEGFRAQRQNDERLQAELARNYGRVALSRSTIGREQDALEPLERARALWEKLVTDHPSVPAYRNELAQTCDSLGVSYLSMKDLERASSFLGQARSLSEPLAALDPTAADYQEVLSRIFNHSGAVQRRSSRPDLALDLHEQARVIQERLLAEHPDSEVYQNDLGSTWCTLGLLHEEERHPEIGVRCFAAARTIQEKLAVHFPGVSEYQRKLATTWDALGRAQRDLGNLEDALHSNEHAREILEKLVADYPEITKNHRDQARTYDTLGTLWLNRGQPDTALQWYERARVIWEKLAADHPGMPEYFMSHVEDLVRVGAHRQAVTRIEELSRNESIPAEVLYTLACMCARAASFVQRDPKLAREDRERFVGSYAACAIDLLARAHSTGYFRNAEMVNHLKTSSDLDALRTRDDFKKLLKALETGRPAPVR
jgi:tetratricopeptide (TPR) repeat protein